jgi:hypothetical protein
MPRGRGFWGRGYWGSRFSYPYNRYQTGYVGSPFWRCRWFPWLPRRWWTGMYGPSSPFNTFNISKEQETVLLTEQMEFLKQEIDQIKKRLEELK